MDAQPRITVQVLAVLNVMLEAPTADWYGLELADRIKLKSGTIYPLLARLEKFGWLASREENIDPVKEGRPRRRLYQLTASGERAAHEHLAESVALLGGTRSSRRRPDFGLLPGGQSA
jgi:DNA-binding PadR family transcriptional regulator